MAHRPIRAATLRGDADSMTTNQAAIRASDHDRDAVVQQLEEQTAQGRLTVAEFQERVDAALTARTWGELAELTNDLPVDLPTPFHSTSSASAASSPGAGRARNACHWACLLPFLLAVVVGVAGAPGVAAAVGVAAAALACVLTNHHRRRAT